MLVLPRIRDFEGLDWKFGRGFNYGLEIPSQEAFKELDDLIDDREYVHPFRIHIVNNAFTQPDALKLMREFGFPFVESKWRKPRRRKLVAPEELERIRREKE